MKRTSRIIAALIPLLLIAVLVGNTFSYAAPVRDDEPLDGEYEEPGTTGGTAPTGIAPGAAAIISWDVTQKFIGDFPLQSFRDCTIDNGVGKVYDYKTDPWVGEFYYTNLGIYGPAWNAPVNNKTASEGHIRGSATVHPTETTTYTLTCRYITAGTINKPNRSLATLTQNIGTVYVTSLLPGVNLTGNPQQLSVGQSSTLTWSSTNADSCQGIGFNTGGATSGSVTVTPSSLPKEYTVTCTNAAGSASDVETLYLSGSPSDVDCRVNTTVGTQVPFTLGVAGEGDIEAGPITYHFKWGDGAITNINTTFPDPHWVTSSHAWSTPGQYVVMGYPSGFEVTEPNPGSYCTSNGNCPTTFWTPTWNMRLTSPNATYVPENLARTSVDFCIVTVEEVPTSGPDLTAGNVTPSTAVPGTPVTLSSVITNSGNQGTVSGFTNVFQVAVNANGTGAQPIGTDTSPVLAVNGTDTTSLSYTFADAGNYYVRVCADQNAEGVKTIPETNEDNNCSAAWTKVTVTNNKADLTVVGLAPSAVVAETPATLTGTLRNNGGAPTPVFSSTVYVCPEGDTECLAQSLTYDNTFMERVARIFTQVAHAASQTRITLNGPAITANNNGTQTGTHTFNTPGNYTMKLCADLPNNTVDESNEGDNCGDWELLVVCNPGDSVVDGACVSSAGVNLTAGLVSTGGGVCINTQTTLTSTVTNAGTNTSDPFPVLFQIKKVSTGSDQLVKSSNIGGLGPNGSGDGSVNYTFSSTGDYQVRACANFDTSWNHVATESNYNDNCSAWLAVSVGAAGTCGPDPDDITCTANPSESSTLPVTVTYTADPSGATVGPYTWSAPDLGALGNGTTKTRTFPEGTTYGDYAMEISAPNGSTGTCYVTIGDACTTTINELKADPNRVNPPGSSTITWKATGDDSCVLKDASGTTVGSSAAGGTCTTQVSGSATVTDITTQSTYTLTCGTATKTVIVNVLPEFIEF